MPKKVLYLLLASIYPAIGTAQAAPPVPVVYQDLYSSLNSYLTTFNQTISSNWNGSKSNVGFAAQLMSANCNVGATVLADPTYFNSVLMELSGLQAMGVEAVQVNADFPCLYSPYYSNQTQYQNILGFYATVAQTVHSRGLKLIVGNTFMIADNVMAQGNPGPYYATLSWSQYETGRVVNAEVTLASMNPDYMVVIEEPDTETLQTGQSQADTVSGSTSLLNLILSAIQTVKGATKIGAGIGTWTPQYQSFIQAYAGTSVDFIDMHVFEVNDGFLPAAQSIADQAIAAGKGVSISAAWLSKIRDTEITTLSGDDLSARDPFSFWAPLDTAFLNMLINFSEWKHSLFLVPFFSQYLRANLPYNTSNSSLSDAQMNTTELSLETTNIQLGLYTTVGTAYSRAILPQADTQVPSTVQGLVGYPAPQSVVLDWSASTDNVGVAGYAVFRNGIQIGTTTQTYYQDLGLTSIVSNGYAVAAFDVAGNMSTRSVTVNVFPQDTVPPVIPSTVTAIAPYTTEVQVTWQAAQSPLPIAVYRVYRGTTASNFAAVGTRLGTKYTDYPVTPATTYCYAIVAEDAQGNLSAPTPAVCVKTPAKK